MDREEPRWLDEGEMRTWRAYVLGSALLEQRLHADLQDGHGLAFSDYELLVRLSEGQCGRVRMSTLAEQVAASKSRVSHQIARMERAGLVRREECPSDGRGVFAVLTDTGREALEAAAPTHLDGVRRDFVDLLSPGERDVLAGVFERVIGHLRE